MTLDGKVTIVTGASRGMDSDAACVFIMGDWGDDLYMAESPERLHTSFQDAFNRHDLDSILALYEPGAVLAGSNGPVQGIDAIREAYRGFLAMLPTITLQTLGVNRTGDLAMLHGKWILLGTGPDGNPIRREGRNTETARRQGDGRWLFVIDNPSVPQD
jgi:uncharacterized protein (TIGR02246 family)